MTEQDKPIQINIRLHLSKTMSLPERIEQELQINQFVQQEFAENQMESQKQQINRNQDNNKGQWSNEEQLKLFQMHDKIGNKWAIIAQQLINRTDNAVKNHFYSKLRKALRKLNKIVSSQFKKQFKEIKVIVLYKIIEATQQRYKELPSCNPEVSDLCTELKNRLLKYSYDENTENDYQKNPAFANQLIFDLINFSKSYRRKAKKPRKNSTTQNDLLSPTRNIKSKKSNSEYEQSEGSSFLPSDCSIFSSQISEHNSHEKLNLNQNIVTRRRAKSKQDIYHRDPQVDHEEHKIEEDQVQDILKESGILEDQFLPLHLDLLKKQSSQAYQSVNDENEDFRFFEESQMQMRIFPATNQGNEEYMNTFLNEKHFNSFY